MASVIVHFSEELDRKINGYKFKNGLPNRDITVQMIVDQFFKDNN